MPLAYEHPDTHLFERQFPILHLLHPLRVHFLLLGGVGDDIWIYLCQQNNIVAAIEVDLEPPGPSQLSLEAEFVGSHGVEEGSYTVVLVVNGEQALSQSTLEIF